jgi:hypothetical protein
VKRNHAGPTTGDEVVTYDDVVRWLPRNIARELTMALPPEIRGWYTEEEAARDGGRFMNITKATEVETKYIRVQDRQGSSR